MASQNRGGRLLKNQQYLMAERDKCVLAYHKDGLANVDIALLYNIHKSQISRILKRLKPRK